MPSKTVFNFDKLLRQIDNILQTMRVYFKLVMEDFIFSYSYVNVTQ